jgi:hypothetical protein
MVTRLVLTILLSALFFVCLTGFVGMPLHPPGIEPDTEELIKKQRIVYRIEPESRGGEGFKLIYLVPVPVDVFWRFKTDFSGDFLLTNKFIKKHRLILQSGDTIITENRYSNAPNDTFRWRTTMFRDQYRLMFQLENPHECGHRFHHGTIQMEPFRSYTKVTHIAYFDFFGAFVWANLRIGSGMKPFLMYTASWEKDTILRLRHQYESDPPSLPR